MEARKLNKVLTIEKAEQQSYQHAGYDIYSDDGKLVARGESKVVTAKKFDEALAKIAELEAKLKGKKDGKAKPEPEPEPEA